MRGGFNTVGVKGEELKMYSKNGGNWQRVKRGLYSRRGGNVKRQRRGRRRKYKKIIRMFTYETLLDGHLLLASRTTVLN